MIRHITDLAVIDALDALKSAARDLNDANRGGRIGGGGASLRIGGNSSGDSTSGARRGETMTGLLTTDTLPAVIDALSTTAEASRRIHEALERCQGSDSRETLYFLGRATERLNLDRETLYAAVKLFMEAVKLDIDRILAGGGESNE